MYLDTGFETLNVKLCELKSWELTVVNILASVGTKNIPPEKKTCGKTSSQITKAGAGEQSLPLGCRATARVKGVFFQRQRYYVYATFVRITIIHNMHFHVFERAPTERLLKFPMRLPHPPHPLPS